MTSTDENRPPHTTHNTFLNFANKSELAILAIRHWSQGPLQSPLQNFKKGTFWRNFGSLLNFLYEWLQKPFNPSLLLFANSLLSEKLLIKNLGLLNKVKKTSK
jgi:hypothetical protein